MYRLSEDDFILTGGIASAEPFQKPDHKAKKHSRPRRNEKVGGGHFVFRRGDTTGRIKTGHIMRGAMPFEHPSLASAQIEAARLQKQFGGRYDVLSVSSTIGGTDWDATAVDHDIYEGVRGIMASSYVNPELTDAERHVPGNIKHSEEA